MFGDQICLSALLTARGAPPPLARAPALEDSLSSRGPQALLTARGAPPPPAALRRSKTRYPRAGRRRFSLLAGPTPQSDPGSRTTDPEPATRDPRPATHCYMLRLMFKRQRTGSVVCASCGSLVGVND